MLARGTGWMGTSLLIGFTIFIFDYESYLLLYSDEYPLKSVLVTLPISEILSYYFPFCMKSALNSTGFSGSKYLYFISFRSSASSI